VIGGGQEQCGTADDNHTVFVEVERLHPCPLIPAHQPQAFCLFHRVNGGFPLSPLTRPCDKRGKQSDNTSHHQWETSRLREPSD